MAVSEQRRLTAVSDHSSRRADACADKQVPEVAELPEAFGVSQRVPVSVGIRANFVGRRSGSDRTCACRDALAEMEAEEDLAAAAAAPANTPPAESAVPEHSASDGLVHTDSMSTDTTQPDVSEADPEVSAATVGTPPISDGEAQDDMMAP